jgi:hypothetical protein
METPVWFRNNGAGRDTYYKNPKTDILNTLGIDFESYRSKMLEVAFRSSSEYFRLRSECRKKMLESIMLMIYELVYNSLTRGIINSGNGNNDTKIFLLEALQKPVAYQIFEGATQNFISPNFSAEEANKLAVSVAQGFKSILEKDIIDVLMPQNVFDNALGRAKKVSENQLLGN